VRLVFAGTPQTSVPALEALLASSHEVAAVITRPDAPAGRGRHVVAGPVAERAAAAGVEVLKPARARDPEFLDRLRKIAPDCCPVVAYGALLPRAALDIPVHGWVNLHFSLLPAWRGAAPVQHAILHGDEITGAATFEIEEALDTGPVYGLLTEPIRPADTTGDLLERLSHAGAKLLADTMDGIAEGALRPRPQSAEGVSYAPKLTPELAQVDWSAPALRVDRLVRACTPAPGPWTIFRGERLKLGPVRPAADAEPLAPGELRVSKPPSGGSGGSGRQETVYVGTGTHPVALGEVQPQGRRRMAAADWARGSRLSDQDRLA
jgi:methionyl-tRNA formyltransferase